jgi:hypothetical protein
MVEEIAVRKVEKSLPCVGVVHSSQQARKHLRATAQVELISIEEMLSMCSTIFL